MLFLLFDLIILGGNEVNSLYCFSILLFSLIIMGGGIVLGVPFQ